MNCGCDKKYLKKFNQPDCCNKKYLNKCNQSENCNTVYYPVSGATGSTGATGATGPISNPINSFIYAFRQTSYEFIPLNNPIPLPIVTASLDITPIDPSSFQLTYSGTYEAIFYASGQAVNHILSIKLLLNGSSILGSSYSTSGLDLLNVSGHVKFSALANDIVQLVSNNRFLTNFSSVPAFKPIEIFQTSSTAVIENQTLIILGDYEIQRNSAVYVTVSEIHESNEDFTVNNVSDSDGNNYTFIASEIAGKNVEGGYFLSTSVWYHDYIYSTTVSVIANVSATFSPIKIILSATNFINTAYPSYNGNYVVNHKDSIDPVSPYFGTVITPNTDNSYLLMSSTVSIGNTPLEYSTGNTTVSAVGYGNDKQSLIILGQPVTLSGSPTDVSGLITTENYIENVWAAVGVEIIPYSGDLEEESVVASLDIKLLSF